MGIISRFLTKDELNDLAHALREESLADGRDGKMIAGEAGVQPVPSLRGLSFFGPALASRLPEPLFTGSAAGALVCGFPRPVLASAVVCDVPPGSGLPSNLPPPPAISFRAAAAANMLYRALPVGDDYSFEWQIRELHWLPSVKDKKRGE
ncbi:hypothetical protein FACS189450_01810 [Spirochaetia bacterium]|nr:hypothetical protein FACS189450_01810 [Spirochaetia bacterium]